MTARNTTGPDDGTPRAPENGAAPPRGERALQAETDGGLASSLQPGGVEPGGGPGAGQGSIGTGGGSTAGRDTGDVKRGGV
jgi:hypothetical protein